MHFTFDVWFAWFYSKSIKTKDVEWNIYWSWFKIERNIYLNNKWKWNSGIDFENLKFIQHIQMQSETQITHINKKIFVVN